MTTTITKINTWLPVFPGFYGTIFEPNTDDELYYQNQERDDSLPKIEWDDLDFDNQEYERDVVKQCCSFLEDELKNYVSAIKFEGISSPREYNFANDSGNVEIELTNENIQAIRDYIYKNIEAYKKYLKRYKSYDGFMSFYGYDFKEWVEYTHDFLDYSDNEHYLGSVLEFICQNEDITDEAMYYSLEVYASSYCKDRTTQVKCEDCGEWYEQVDSPEHKEYELTLEKQVRLWKETQGDKPYKTKTFNECYPDFGFKCSDCK